MTPLDVPVSPHPRGAHHTGRAIPPAALPSGSHGARRVARWAVSALLVVHGLLHLLGDGAAWTVAAATTVAAGVLLATGVRWWWLVGALAALLSQLLVLGAWDEAWAGTLANVVLVVAVVHGFASQGPASLRARYRQQSTEALTAAADGPDLGVVTEDDLRHLPPPVAAYVARSGAVGRPRVRGFRAQIHGRIRGSADAAWMVWTGEQTNALGAQPARLLFMDATMKGLPTDVLHSYRGPTARMQVRPLSVVPLIDATGPDMTQAETVTLLNDLCVLAPAALVDAPIRWTPVDDRQALATYRNGPHTVTATLVFDDDHDLVDFVSDDRLQASPDGRTFARRRWSTPLGEYRVVDGRRVASFGFGRWHPEPPDTPFDYLEFHVDAITYV